MPKVCVIGSINMDLIIRVDHMPEGGENVYCRDVSAQCGGKGENQAIALASLGVETSFFGSLGQDDYGNDLLKNLSSHQIDCSAVLRKDCKSGVAYIFVESDGENRIIVDPGANERITSQDIREKAYPLIEKADLVLIQLEIPLDCITEIIQLCKRLNKKLIIDAGPIRGCKAERLAGAYCVSPNRSELGALLGKTIETEEEVLQGAKELLDIGAGSVLIKLGSKGCLYADRNKILKAPAYSVSAVDTTGAGDSFTAGYACMILEGKTVEEAMDFANRCGAIAVMNKGACSGLPIKEEVYKYQLRRP